MLCMATITTKPLMEIHIRSHHRVKADPDYKVTQYDLICFLWLNVMKLWLF